MYLVLMANVQLWRMMSDGKTDNVKAGDRGERVGMMEMEKRRKKERGEERRKGEKERIEESCEQQE